MSERQSQIIEKARNVLVVGLAIGTAATFAACGGKEESTNGEQAALCGDVNGFTGMDMDDFGLNEERVLPKSEEDNSNEFIAEVSSLALIMDSDDENKDVYASSLASLYSVIHSSPKDKDGFVDPDGKDLNVSYQEALDTMFPGDEFDKEATVKLCQEVSDYLVKNTDEAEADDINLIVGELKFAPEGDDPEALRIKKLVKAEGGDIDDVLVVKDPNGNKVLAYITENDENEVRVFLPIDPSKGAQDNKDKNKKFKVVKDKDGKLVKVRVTPQNTSGGGGSGTNTGEGGGKGGERGGGCGGSCGSGDKGGSGGGGGGGCSNCGGGGGGNPNPGPGPEPGPNPNPGPEPGPNPNPDPNPDPDPDPEPNKGTETTPADVPAGY